MPPRSFESFMPFSNHHAHFLHAQVAAAPRQQRPNRLRHNQQRRLLIHGGDHATSRLDRGMGAKCWGCGHSSHHRCVSTLLSWAGGVGVSRILYIRSWSETWHFTYSICLSSPSRFCRKSGQLALGVQPRTPMVRAHAPFYLAFLFSLFSFAPFLAGAFAFHILPVEPPLASTLPWCDP